MKSDEARELLRQIRALDHAIETATGKERRSLLNRRAALILRYIRALGLSCLLALIGR